MIFCTSELNAQNSPALIPVSPKQEEQIVQLVAPKPPIIQQLEELKAFTVI